MWKRFLERAMARGRSLSGDSEQVPILRLNDSSGDKMLRCGCGLGRLSFGKGVLMKIGGMNHPARNPLEEIDWFFPTLHRRPGGVPGRTPNKERQPGEVAEIAGCAAHGCSRQGLTGLAVS